MITADNYHESLHNIQKDYLNALLNKDRQSAEKLITDSLNNNVPIKDIYLSVFQPAQWEIGRLWQTNKITVAMEHYCTAATQFIMSRLYDHIFSTEKNGLSLVATSVSGELHELGIRMVSDFFEMEGWHTYYLGANSTKEGILDMIKECNADILAISATMYYHIPHVQELITYIRQHNESDKLKIMVGGKAFNMGKNLWKETKADIYALDAQAAIEKSTEILSVNN
ncbi:MAG: hypothetical protein C0598_10415 [Marinilabiliales bacterium]|nr:MAG: hypothetical protein C0598_10415 [Marinilabiliales bacterium]